MMDPRLVRYLETLGVGPDALDGWTVKIAQRDGKDCGFVLVKGPEIHMHAFDDGAMSRRNILEHMAPILAEYGYCTTRVPIAETDHKLRRALDFEMTWQDASFTYWATTKLPFQRKRRE
jgi:hypothetical protein